MVDTRFCTAGKDAAGSWFIACKTSQQDSQTLLGELGFGGQRSKPADAHYDSAARHIRAQGGLFWRTNARGEYTTIAGIPETIR